jgi:hypothetical protein
VAPVLSAAGRRRWVSMAEGDPPLSLRSRGREPRRSCRSVQGPGDRPRMIQSTPPPAGWMESQPGESRRAELGAAPVSRLGRRHRPTAPLQWTWWHRLDPVGAVRRVAPPRRMPAGSAHRRFPETGPGARIAMSGRRGLAAPAWESKSLAPQAQPAGWDSGRVAPGWWLGQRALANRVHSSHAGRRHRPWEEKTASAQKERYRAGHL